MIITSKIWISLMGALVGLGVALSADGAFAQNLPNKEDQELLVKTTLLTLNDANLTGDYSVLHDKLSKPFRDQFDVQKLKDIFKDFVDKHIDMSVVAIKSAIPDADGVIDKDHILQLSGSFDTKPKAVKYKLSYSVSENLWKPIGIHVSTE